jgi:zinc protease
MARIYSVYVSVFFLLTAVAVAQEVKVEKYKLGNGMNVILHEDHSLPVACINTWYYVGSKDEAPGRSGFAHLFEHLMFMGTKRVPGGDFDTIMETGGGNNNASTSEDRTNYYSFGPASLLPKLLWLDADRLEDLGKEMTQEKLDKQREIVRNERRQTSEMQPYGKADLKISELMYPPGHPYHISVIGTHEDLQAASVRDVKDFFANYYVPNNASLVVAGDFDPAVIKPLIEKLFGSLPRDAQPVHKTAEPVKLGEVRRVTYTDQVQYPRTTIVYHSPAHFQAGDAEMDLAAAVLADGKSSRLYKRLVYEDKLASEVDATQSSNLLQSLFTIEITARPGVSLDKIEAVADEVLAEFIAKGPTAEELERQKSSIEYATIASLQSILTKADRLNQYEAAWGEPNSFKRDLDRYRKATPEDVKNWSQKVLTPDSRLVMRVLPEEEQKTSPRDKNPDLLADKGFSPQQPEVFKLSNGLEVRFWKKNELPLVNVSLMIRGGAAVDDPHQAGRAFMMANMLDEGAGKLGSLEFSDALDLLGASFIASASQETITVGLSTLKRNLDKALDLFADALLRPRFEQKEWDRVKTLHIQSLKQQEDRAPAVAGKVGMRTYFGDDHPYGRPVDGTAQTIEELKLEQIKDAHAEYIRPDKAVMFIAGDLTLDEAKAALERALGGWKREKAGVHDMETVIRGGKIAPPEKKPLRVALVDKPGSVQTVIRFYMPGEAYQTPNRVVLNLINTILGGSFTSRLNQNLREQHGYTYGARSGFHMEPSMGYFTAGADVQAEHTGEALKEFLKEFERIRGGDISKDEAAKARETNRVEFVESFQGLRGILGTAEELEEVGLPFTTIGDDLAKLKGVSEADLNSQIKAAIPLENGLLVLVGDKKTVMEQLKGLQLPTPSEYTVSGEPAVK